MRYRTIAVDPCEVEDLVTVAAQALWAAVWSVLLINEQDQGSAQSVLPARGYVEKYGPWTKRRERGITALADFYRTWYGDEAGALIVEYFEARTLALSATHDVHVANAPLREARLRLVFLHGGYVVDDSGIRKVGKPLGPGETSPFEFDAGPTDVA